jgi:hypothetical protein
MLIKKVADAENKLQRVEVKMEEMADSLAFYINKNKVDKKAQTAKAH